MLYIIGVGLSSIKDITVRGYEIVKKCHHVYLEHYTSILPETKDVMEEFFGRQILLLDREDVECRIADTVLAMKENEDVAFLVVGDPFAATTHADLVLRARKQNIKVKVIHNASIMTAIGCCGLQLYSFGTTVSIPFRECFGDEPIYYPSTYENIALNRKRGLHTLCLLDIKVNEPSMKDMARGKTNCRITKFMNINQAANILIAALDDMIKENKDLEFTHHSLVVGLARVGCDDQKIVACSLQDMMHVDIGPPLHCLIIPAPKLHPLEIEFLEQYALDIKEFKKIIT